MLNKQVGERQMLVPKFTLEYKEEGNKGNKCKSK